MKEIIYKLPDIKYEDIECPSCKNKTLIYGPIECPDNIPDCCVMHFGYFCHTCNKTFQ